MRPPVRILAPLAAVPLAACSQAPAAGFEEASLEGSWCLVRLVGPGTTASPRESWRFAPDGALTIVRGSTPERREGYYDLRGERITTSLAVTLVVRRLDDEALVAEVGDREATFRRGPFDPSP